VFGDLALFALLFILQIGLFLISHCIVLRSFRKRNLLYCAAASVLASAGIAILFGYFLFSGMFSSGGAWAVSITGSALASLFACGLYTFLGPVTADRSLACQMLVSLTEKGQKLADKYIFLLRLLRLKERAGYVQYFTTDENKDRE